MSSRRRQEQMNRLWARLRRSAEFRAARLQRGETSGIRSDARSTETASPLPLVPSKK